MPVTLIAHTSFVKNVTSGNVDTTGASFIIAVVAGYSGSSVITDSKSNTWRLSRPRITLPDTSSLDIYECFPTSVGSGHNFSSTGNFTSGCVAAFSGVTSKYAVNTATAASISPGSLVLPNAGQLIVTGLLFEAANTVSVDAPFTITDQVNFVTATYFGTALAYVITASANSYAPTWSYASACNAAADLAVYGG